MKGTDQLLNIHLKYLGDQIKDIACNFESITFSHVFNEQSSEAYTLSKDGHQVPEGWVLLEEIKEEMLQLMKIINITNKFVNLRNLGQNLTKSIFYLKNHLGSGTTDFMKLTDSQYRLPIKLRLS